MAWSRNLGGGLTLLLAACVSETAQAPEADEAGTRAWAVNGAALAKLATPCTFDNGAAKKFTVTLVDGESALIGLSAKGALQVNGDKCTATATPKALPKAIDINLADGFLPDGRGVRVMLDYSGGALVTAGATTAPVTVTLGGRAQDEVWVRTSSKPDFVNVTTAGVVSVGTAATNTKKDIALKRVGGLSLFLGAGADVVKAVDALLPITAYGSADADVITTGNANDRLDGGDGDDTLVGGEGDDALIGGAGDDTLDGQEGCDACDGGEGVDTNLDDQSAAKVEGVEADLGKGRSVCGRTLPPGTLIVDEVSGVAYDFSLIPAGKSVLGARSDDAEAASNERPTHDVTHSRPFLMGRTEVTQAQYQAVVGNNPSLHQGPPLRPVEWVSWYDSVTFCNRLSDAAGRMRAYDESNRWNLSADGYRLPTEAEWEFAARAGTASPRYGPVDDISWNGGNSGGVTHEVATRTPNEWGLHDVLGNVWERVWDDYSTYDAAPTVDPIGSPLPSGDGLLRGGSWCCTIDAVRLSTRYPYGRALLGGNVGFRLARWQE